MRAKAGGTRGSSIDLDENVGVETIQEVLKKTPKFWTRLQAHIQSFDNKQECIDFFNNLNGIDKELSPDLGDVLLKDSLDFEFALIRLSDAE